VPIFAGNGYPDVGAVSAREAARVFANLLARAVSGRVESVSVPNALKM
jgi:hypothetical protein